MIHCLSLELTKTKRRGIWLVLATFLMIIVLWGYNNLNDDRFLAFGWMMALYDLPILNAVMIPTGIAVFASRVIDMEHKGSTWKLLETLQSKFELYMAKVLYGFIAVLLFCILELIFFVAIGFSAGFEGTPDWWAYGLLFVQTFVITFNLYLLQMIISLFFTNQAVALCTGLCGSMAGLFLMYVPQWSFLRNLIPWGHYGAMMFVGMNWNKEQSITGFYYFQQDHGTFLFVGGWFLLLFAGGWLAFKNMDTDGYHFALKRLVQPGFPTDVQSTKLVTIPSVPVEILKIKRSPIWLAFIVLPLISALIGTCNYLNNLEILTSTWHSLWTQHALFFCYFFMPPLVGVYASYLWRLEHSGANWNMVLTTTPAWRLVFNKIAMCTAITFFTLGWLCILYILCGLYAGITDPIPAELLEWLACGVLGGTAVCAAQCFLSLVIRSFAVPIGMALIGGIGGLFLTTQGLYFLLPYSLLSMGMRANNPTIQVNLVEFASCSVLFIVLFYLMSVFYIRRNDVKTQS